MIEELPNNILLVSYGDWYVRLGNLYLGYDRVKEYTRMGYQINWISAYKIKVYIHVKMIKGDPWRKAVDRVLNKEHLNDTDYRDIERE